MLDTLRKLIRQAGASKEEDTDRDGFLSYSVETHALGIGVYHGLRTKRPWHGEADLPDNPDVKQEPHYYKSGFVVGTLLQWGGIALMAVASGVL